MSPDPETGPASGDELRKLLEAVREFLETRLAPAAPPTVPDRELQTATATLCLAMLRADHESRQDEHRALERVLGRLLHLDGDDTARLIRHAEGEMDLSRPLRAFAELVDRGYSRERKIEVVEALWRVAYADAEIQAHEEYLVRKIASLLGLGTADLIEAKIRARQAFLDEDL